MEARNSPSSTERRLAGVSLCCYRNYSMSEGHARALVGEAALHLSVDAGGEQQRPVLFEGRVVAAHEAAAHLFQPLAHLSGVDSRAEVEAAPREGGLFRRDAEQRPPQHSSEVPGAGPPAV